MFAGHSGGTISYFSDIETSLANLLQAGEWEEEPPPEQIVETDELLAPFAAKMVDEGEGEVAGVNDVADTPEVPEDTPPVDEPTDEPADTGGGQMAPIEPPTPAADDTPPAEPPADEPAADEPVEPDPTPEPPSSDPEPTPEPPAEEPVAE